MGAEALWLSSRSNQYNLSQGKAKCETGRSFFLDWSNVHPYLAQSLTLLMSRHRSEHTNRPGDSHPQSLLGPSKRSGRMKGEGKMKRLWIVFATLILMAVPAWAQRVTAQK